MRQVPISILHIVEPGSGGTLRHVLDLARAQADVGHRVRVIYSPLRLAADYEAAMQNMVNVSVHPLPMRRALHGSDIPNLFALVKMLCAETPDILHAHSTKAGMMARLARLFVRTRVIYTPHAMMSLNPDMPRWQRALYGFYERAASWLTDRVVVLSQHEMAHANALGISAEKIMMAQNGVRPMPPSDRAGLRAALHIPPHAPVVGFVGRMTAQKNPQLAVRAFAAARAQRPDLMFCVIGDGELLAECRALASQLGVADAVRWLGAVDALPHYAAMDALLVTSRYEGMAYVFLEALNAGVPMVTTDVGGCESTVIPHQTGVIASANAEDLGKWVAQILSDDAMHDAMRFACRARGQHFGIAPMLESVMAIYADALSPNP